jgi:bifunctional enzyme CysN/CysC
VSKFLTLKKIEKIPLRLEKSQRPCVVWFTGISGAGKTTVARLVEERLQSLGKYPYVIDGDIMRKGLSKDLGFDEKSRIENIRRAAEVSLMMVDAGLIVLAAFISPFASERAMVRTLVGGDRFIEVFMDTPLEIAEKRDPKGLYRRARAGGIKNFTGIDSAYEIPSNPNITLATGNYDIYSCCLKILTSITGFNGHL